MLSLRARAGRRIVAGADQPVVAARRLQHAQDDRQPQGELKAQIDALDREIAEASRLGKTGEVRRLFAKGTTLLAGRPWTDAADYAGSLVIRTDRVVVDSSQAVHGAARADLQPVDPARAAAEGARRVAHAAAPAAAQAPAPPPPRVVKDLGAFDGVGRDLRDSPFPFDLDLQGVADGTYQLAIEVQRRRAGARNGRR